MPPTTRRRLNSRSFRIDGYVRDDGRYEIEGRLVDDRADAYRSPWLGELPAGRPLHEMTARVVIDDAYVVHEVDVATLAAPYPGVCPTVVPAFQKLVGASMLRDWSRSLRTHVGGVHGCTHIVELLGRMATVALHTVYLHQEQTGAWERGTARPEHALFVDGCHALAGTGELARGQYPIARERGGAAAAGAASTPATTLTTAPPTASGAPARAPLTRPSPPGHASACGSADDAVPTGRSRSPRGSERDDEQREAHGDSGRREPDHPVQ